MIETPTSFQTRPFCSEDRCDAHHRAAARKTQVHLSRRLRLKGKPWNAHLLTRKTKPLDGLDRRLRHVLEERDTLIVPMLLGAQIGGLSYGKSRRLSRRRRNVG